MKTYTIGLDFGTLSGRAVLADVSNGEILADSVSLYKHGVITGALPDGTPLPQKWALQDPQDYLDVMDAIIPAVIRKSGVRPELIAGICVDFTSATVMPVLKDGTPLCMLPEFRSEPHAYAKLWKHHSAEKEAADIRTAFEAHDPARLRDNLQITSSESEFAKVLETLRGAPEVYRRAAYFLEAGDWLTFRLCGRMTQSVCGAGFKGLYHAEKGWPDIPILTGIDPRLENYFTEKWSQPVCAMGECVGHVTKEAAARLGLPENCAVAASVIDGHAAPPACGVTKEGTLLMILGTGSTHTIISNRYRPVPGICGVVKGGIYPGLYAYDAGQCCVGDHYDWFASGYFPQQYCKEADGLGISAQEYLTRKASRLAPGESGLLALDWWNGNRSPLMDSGLKGLMLGMTLRTKPEDIYRALIESTAFGARLIHDNYRGAGFSFSEVHATGGICGKNPLVMQIYADILNIPLRLAGIRFGSALGSAMYAAVAAGSNNGGYDDILEAAERMKDVSDTVYEPDAEHVKRYEPLFEEYKKLYRFFGVENPGLMHSL